MRKEYHRDDFTLPLRLRDGDGAEIIVGGDDFTVEFSVGVPMSVPVAARATRPVYTACRRGGRLENCRVEPDGRLSVIFDGHGLPPGKLYCRLTLESPDASYPDGLRRRVFDGPAGVLLTPVPVGKDDHGDAWLTLSYAHGVVTVLGHVELETDEAVYRVPVCGTPVEREVRRSDCEGYYGYGYGGGDYFMIGAWDL